MVVVQLLTIQTYYHIDNVRIENSLNKIQVIKLCWTVGPVPQEDLWGSK